MNTEKEERLKQTGLIGFYVSPKIGCLLLAFVAFIAYMHTDLAVRFEANVPLNTLIIGTTLSAITLVLRNVLMLQTSANVLRRLEAFEENPSEEESLAIFHLLRKKAALINTYYMEGAILSLRQPGYLRFDDNQARVIKSKVGQRTTRMRHSAQYLAGVLVMLGLIGTFWGLLETITSVGEAMGAIVKTFSTNSNSDTSAGMLGFLGSISKPLQGMGIAFSASLFGLSGSLITGLLNSFCGKGMDRFLEDFSVWLDTRIPPRKKQAETTNPVEIIEAHNLAVIRALEQALAGISQQSHQMFGTLTGLIGELSTFSTEQAQLTRQLTAEKRETQRIASAFDVGFNALRDYVSGVSGQLAGLPSATGEMREEVIKISGLMQNMHADYAQQQRQTFEQMEENRRQQTAIYQNLSSLFEGHQTMTQLQSQIVEGLDVLHGSTIEQKDKIIDMVLAMQRILQAQLTPSLEIENVLPLPASKRQ